VSLAADWDSAVTVGAKPGGDLGSQWEDAKPVKLPKAAPKTENPRSAKNLAGAAIEPGISLATGALAGPASGLAGIAGAMLPGPPGQGARWAHKVGDRMTYEPRTTGGRNAMEAISYPFRKFGEAADYAGGKAAEVTGSPAVGAGVNTAIQALPQLAGARGASMLKKPPARELAPDVKTLADRGVKLTPGEMVPKLKRVEEAFESIPFAGDIVKDARGRSSESFNRATWNDALTAAGEKPLPKTVKTGNEASAHVRQALGDRYDDLLGKMVGRLDNAPAKNALPAPGQVGQPPKPSLRQELDQLLNLAKQDGGLPSREMRTLRHIVDKEIKAKFDKNGMAPGDSLKAIHETLGKEQASFAKGGPYERKLADAIKEADAAVRRMVRDARQARAFRHAAGLRHVAPRSSSSTRGATSSTSRVRCADARSRAPGNVIWWDRNRKDGTVRTAGQGHRAAPGRLRPAAHEVSRLGRPHRARRQHELPRHAGAVPRARATRSSARRRRLRSSSSTARSARRR
jgi:hypothetical protein